MGEDRATPAPEELQIVGCAGVPIVLPLSVGPATGYEWALEVPTGVVRIADSDPDDAADPDRLGAPSGGRLRIIAVEGQHELRARLARPWEEGAERDVVIRLRVI